MIHKWREVTGMITVRDDEGNNLEFEVVSEFTENRTMRDVTVAESCLKDCRSPDGRTVYSRAEGEFFFEDEPDRIYRVVEE